MSQPEDQYNKGGLIALVFSVGFCLLFFGYISFIHPGVDLKEIPEEVPGAEQVMATTEEADVDVSKVTNPWVSSPEMVAHGKKVYATNCALCHGSEGKGDGVAGKALQPPPRNLVEGGWKQGGTSIDLFKTLQTGIPGTSMAPFQHLPTVDRWSLVHFIRSITKDKPADDDAKVEEFAKSAK